ncbi:MAG: FliI/YscN family ATPase [Bdellovibrionaceae bacterium]|nr:FliI/YscN family ATPase [Pseudobdellovibrionaceae bacterium]
MSLDLNLQKYWISLDRAHLSEDSGKITHVIGQMMLGYLPGATVGSICHVFPAGFDKFSAEVIGFRDRNVLLMPLGEMRGVGLGSRIVLHRQMATIKVGPQLLGRVVNAFGEPIDGKGPIESMDEALVYNPVSNPLDRDPIREPMDLGVRAINGLVTVGRGQRVGIMAGSGVGKSVLMGMLAKGSNSDVNVIALIGERGREVKEFIEEILGTEGMKRSVVVVATSDQSPLMRMRGAFVATTIAEYFSDRSAHVLLMMDSVTRFAMAQREIGLSAGEPPASKGYTPSVFALLPKMLERVGAFEGKGSITGLYTVLVEGDDMDDPIADSVRSIVDGHIVLDRALASRGHFPAIDVLQSTSRVMRSVVDSHHVQLARAMRENMAIYRDAEDLINIGAYKSGANPEIDHAIQLHQGITQFLRQDVDEQTSLNECVRTMEAILGQGR